jgi:hypothetical protein
MRARPPIPPSISREPKKPQPTAAQLWLKAGLDTVDALAPTVALPNRFPTVFQFQYHPLPEIMAFFAPAFNWALNRGVVILAYQDVERIAQFLRDEGKKESVGYGVAREGFDLLVKVGPEVAVGTVVGLTWGMNPMAQWGGMAITGVPQAIFGAASLGIYHGARLVSEKTLGTQSFESLPNEETNFKQAAFATLFVRPSGAMFKFYALTYLLDLPVQTPYVGAATAIVAMDQLWQILQGLTQPLASLVPAKPPIPAGAVVAEEAVPLLERPYEPSNTEIARAALHKMLINPAIVLAVLAAVDLGIHQLRKLSADGDFSSDPASHQPGSKEEQSLWYHYSFVVGAVVMGNLVDHPVETLKSGPRMVVAAAQDTYYGAKVVGSALYEAGERASRFVGSLFGASKRRADDAGRIVGVEEVVDERSPEASPMVERPDISRRR